MKRGVPLSFRPRPKMRELLRALAVANNRSLSQEVEVRLERSLAVDAMLDKAVWRAVKKKTEGGQNG